MTTSEAINERIEALNEELSAIHQAQNISRCWAGNHTALLNLDRREAEVCRAINIPAPLRINELSGIPG